MPFSRRDTASSEADPPRPWSLPNLQSQAQYPDLEATEPVDQTKSLSQAIYARRAEYSRPHTARIKIGTWNVGAKKDAENDLAAWFVQKTAALAPPEVLRTSSTSESNNQELVTRDDATQTEPHSGEQGPDQGPSRRGSPQPATSHDKEVGIYVLGLQEIVDISSAAETLLPYSEPSTARKWRDQVEDALPGDYQLVSEHQLVGLLLLVYASPEVLPHVGSVSSTSVGTGIMGFGNKGAVSTRIVLGETTKLVFVNSHLSSGLGKAELDRRNWDALQILNKTKFDPNTDSLGNMSDHADRIGDEDFAFWFGDLNYRLEGIPAEDVRRLLMLHMRDEYNVGRGSAQLAGVGTDSDCRLRSPSEPTDCEPPPAGPNGCSPSSSSLESKSRSSSSDTLDSIDDEARDPRSNPGSLETTLDSLLSHDELHQQQAKRKVLHDGWQEGTIDFFPTYKYDVGSVGQLDSSEKRRGPSWCDRVLYRTRKSRADYENTLIEEQHGRKESSETLSIGTKQTSDEESMLFDYDPEADGEDDGEDDSHSQSGDLGSTASTNQSQSKDLDVIDLEHYSSHQHVVSSDHKPLEAVFQLVYDAVIPDLKAKVHQEVVKDLDKAENENRPALTVIIEDNSGLKESDSNTIEFGNVRFQESVACSLTIANTGKVAAVFSFASHPVNVNDSASRTDSWFTVDVENTGGENNGARSVSGSKEVDDWSRDISLAYSLEPGGACNSTVTASVESFDLLRKLNAGAPLEDVCILRVKNGRDYFLTLRGTWQPSVYGRSLDDLIRIPEGGVREVHEKKKSHESTGPTPDERPVAWSAPREILRLTESIELCVERVIAEWSMRGSTGYAGQPSKCPWKDFPGWPFVEEGWCSSPNDRHDQRLKVNESLDTGEPFDKRLPPGTSTLQRVEAFAATLLEFLRSLEDGVITKDLWTQLEESFFSKDRSRSRMSNDKRRAAILEALSASSPHSVSFVIITSTLSRIAQEVSSVSNDLEDSSAPRSDSIPLSPRFLMRRKAFGSDSAGARRELINKTFASVFADPLTRAPDGMNERAKSLFRVSTQRLIEIFLDEAV